MQLWVAPCDAPRDRGDSETAHLRFGHPQLLPFPWPRDFCGNYVQKPDQSLLQMESNGKIAAKADNQGWVKQKCLFIILRVPRLVCALPSSLLSS